MTFMKYFYVFLDLPWLMQKHNAALVLGLYTSNLKYVVILAAFPHMQAALQPAKLLPWCCL